MWKGDTNAVSYLVQVSLNSTFTDSSFSFNVEDTLKVLENLESNRKYFWKVHPTLSGGNQGSSKIWSFTTMTLPLTFKLYHNHPNPFNPNTTINYQLPVACNVRLIIYDFLGKEAATLLDEYKPAGSYEVEFSSLGGGNNLSSGIYFYCLRAGDYVETKKMILLK